MTRWKRATLAPLAFVIGSAVGTQVFAWQAGYHPTLGQPVHTIGVHQVYLPTAGWTWAQRWAWGHPARFTAAGLSMLTVTAVLLVVVVPLTKKNAPKDAGARWATKQDLQAAGLFVSQGIVLGVFQGKVVRHDGPTHTLCVGPSRSGKGVSHVVPTLLEWPESVFVFDPKAELYTLTAGYRQTMSRVVHLQPTADTSHRFNPLNAIRLNTVHEIRDTQLITDILTDPDSDGDRGGTSQHFREMATDLLTGLVLYGLHTREATTLAAVNALLTTQPFEDLLATMHRCAHPAVQRAASVTGQLADRELSGVVSTTARALRLFTDPLIARATDASDFAWGDLRAAASPMTVYLTIPFAEQERCRPLSRLLVRQMLDAYTQHLTGWSRRLLVLLDEVAALKRMPVLAEGLEFLAGYGVTLMLVTPSLTPLEALYGARNGFWEGCKTRLVFAPNSAGLAHLLARETGETTVEKERTTVTREPFHTFRDRSARSTEQVKEPLLSMTALMQLPQHQVLLLIGNRNPVLLDKITYYTQQPWAARAALQP